MEQYQHILLDFDGVVCDSNSIKSENILLAAKQYTDEDTARKFQTWFTKQTGIPRERKTNSFFKDENISGQILSAYERLNERLINAEIMPGIKDFLSINKNIPFIILSGGNKKEIESYLKKHDLLQFIELILCGPATKEENLKKYPLHGKTLFIGDSLYDFEVAQKFFFDFIFLYGYTQFKEWQSFKFPANVNKFENFKNIIGSVK